MTIPSDQLCLPEHDYVDRVMVDNNRLPAVLHNMQTLYNTGRPVGTGYLSILPVDQGVEYSAGASFVANPLHFNPKNIVELAIETGCNCVASTYGVLVSVSRCCTHHIPLLIKINHDETLSYPNTFDQTLYASVEQALNIGAVAVGAVVHLGSEGSRRQIEEASTAFGCAYKLGMATALWAYLCNSAFKKDGVDYHVSTDLAGQANHLATAIEADIIRQKMVENNGGYKAVNFDYTDDRVYTKLISENPTDLVRYQLVNCYTGRIGLINSGGMAGGDANLSGTVRIAVINEHAGDMGLILGRKAFKKTMADSAKLINAAQDVYLDSKVIIA